MHDKLKELRFKVSAGQYRIFFFFHVGEKAILVHSLQKKTQETPKQDLKIALKRMKDWQRPPGRVGARKARARSTGKAGKP